MSNLDKAIAFYKEYIKNTDFSAVTDVTKEYRFLKYLQGGEASLWEHGPVTIGILGDSVSQGCFAQPAPKDYDAVYHNRLRLMLADRFPNPTINVVNCAVGGVNAVFGVEHFDEVMAHHKPELMILCYGLNDVNNDLEEYKSSVRTLIRKSRAIGSDCIFMTPNMLNTYASPETEVKYAEYAVKTAKMQNEGRMDAFMDAAREVCREEKVPLCDAYAVWKKMAESGIDTTDLLCNRINHPSRKMHLLFAEMLYACLTGEIYDKQTQNTEEDGMIKTEG